MADSLKFPYPKLFDIRIIMNKNNTSSWFPMKMFDKTAEDGVLFGPCLQAEKSNYMYPNERIPKNATVIWVPKEKKTVSLAAYEKAHKTSDEVALAKISKLGIPLGCTFGGVIDWKEK